MDTTRLIASIKINGSVPESDQFNDAAILALSDEVLSEGLLARLISAKEEYFVFRQSFPIIAHKAKYRIPSRAYAGVLRDILKQNGTNIVSLAYLNPEDVQSSSEGTPSNFYLESNSIMLYKTPSTTGDTLVLKYFITPGLMIVPSLAGKVLSIDTVAMSVTLSAVPTSFVASQVLDAIKGTAGFEVLSLGHTITSVAGSTISLSSLPEDLEVGDWLAPTGYSPYPNIPEAFHATLALFTAAKCLQSLGQVDQETAMLSRAESAMVESLKIVSPRVQGEAQKITTPLL